MPASSRRFAPPRQLLKGGDLESLRATLNTNQRYLRRWANRLGGFVDWEPTWTAATTNPVLGNGTLTGTYSGVGNMLIAKYRLIPGSTTTFGSGSYMFNLPEAAQPVADDMAIGQGTVTLGANRYHYLMILDTTGAVHVSPSGLESAWTATNPATFADGDTFVGQVVYEGL